MSDTFIVTATMDDETSFGGFVKVLPSNSIMQTMALEAKVYNREIDMYNSMFDQLRQIRLEAGLSEEDLPLDIPNVYYVHLKDKSKGENDTLDTCVLLEDLSAEGFRMANKYEGCDDAHVRVALQSLANYHALSIAGLKKWKSRDGSVNVPPAIDFILEKTMIELMTNDLRRAWLNPYSKLLGEAGREDLAEWSEEILSQFDKYWITDNWENTGPLACIMHGDFWCNNMLFKYEDGKPTQLKMVDFQIARIGHPICDILYFLYSSTVSEVREQHIESWLSFYFTSLTTALKKLDAEVPDYTFDDFLEDWKKRSPMFMLLAFGILKVILDKGVVSGLQDRHEEAQSSPLTEAVEVETSETDEPVDGFTDNIMDSFISVASEVCDPEVTDRMIKLADEVKRKLYGN